MPSRVNLSTMLLVLISAMLAIQVFAPNSVMIVAAKQTDNEAQDDSANNQMKLKQEKPQARVGGLDPSDYVDEAGELEIMANQQQIPTAQLMAAAGHSIPDNYFIPGGSIPALYALRYQQNLYQQQQQQLQQQQQQQQQQQHQHQQQQRQEQQQVDPMQQVASQHVQARHIASGKLGIRQADLIAAATAAAEQQQDLPSLVDYNGYNLVSGGGVATSPAGGDSSMAAGSQQGPTGPAQAVELAEFLNPSSQQALYEQQQQQQLYALEQQLVAELAALQRQQQEYQAMDQQAQASENSAQDQYASQLGPGYQVDGMTAGQASYESGQVQKGSQYQQQQQRSRPLGLPTKSSNKEPSDMLKPLGNPKTISSPAIDFVTNQLPKTSQLEKLAEKVPQLQVPTAFSFASSKDPSEKVKVVNQKKRNVMRQAEQLAKMMIKSVNDKFGTNIGDQTDLPFLLSSLTPLGLAQNILLDPTLIVTLLNSIEKTYLSDVLPGPAKAAIRPVLNIFRMPNKKRDKANLSNVISFLASGMQAPSQGQVKHRQGTGIERASKNNKNSR